MSESIKNIKERMGVGVGFLWILGLGQFMIMHKLKPPLPPASTANHVVVEDKAAKEMAELLKKGESVFVEAPPLNPVGRSVGTPGTKLADKKADAKEKNDVIVMQESIMSFLFHLSAQQKASLDKGSENMKELQELVKAQNEQIQYLQDRATIQQKQVEMVQEKTSSVESKLNVQTEQQKQNMKKIVKLFSTMPADKVAKIFEDMEDEPVALLFSNMKEVDVAKVLSVMPSRRAAQLTLRMGDIKGKKS